MKAWDYDAVTYDGAVYCSECIPAMADREDICPIFASDEWDYAPCCDKCGTVHEYMNILNRENLED